ncbi:bifunctional phosphopantothenoylcysteine decarboxylase/phosphopantothenate--cysteine ligase CoaBC [uncultured Propionibacterium sp.]|uniref:bifunctional phosphopantothenoylcysteine decarboxylase/phosphopantothenate--cysteine ligase CoaBC n=1 Tax=uncultured Propionibacterium sp. TaxID=218066 RepID=UPI0029303F37|nr:bifunctional phosphopantothenoylcysteine decarboxylase/phosphopantothenate--cysteine ligase CoaBC [uncultured Propionibacterium sp.]
MAEDGGHGDDRPTVLLGIGASIAAYKAAGLASALTRAGVDVQAVMTPRASAFIPPLVLEALTGNPCPVEVVPSGPGRAMEHIDLARGADLVLVAPASADVIGRIANGLADDLLTTTILACTCPVLVAPAMNTRMLANPAVQANLARLAGLGHEVVAPGSGRLACGDAGPGRMPDEQVLVARVLRRLGFAAGDEAAAGAPKIPDGAACGDLAGLRVLVTAGATVERIDPVRCITNRSTGRMGFALARAARDRGARVTLVAGSTAEPPPQMDDTIRVESAEQMFQAVAAEAQTADVVIMAAAVADYRPRHVADQKIKKGDGPAVLELERTRDILAWLGAHRRAGQILCGFSMETTDLVANSRRKLEEKGIDLIVANDLSTPGAGFGVDTNVVTVITPEGRTRLPLMSKREVAEQVLSAVLNARAGR